MRLPVMVNSRYIDAAKRLAAASGMRPGDVLCIALEHHIEMVGTISRAGLGDRPMVAGDLPGLFVRAVNLLAAQAAQSRVKA